MSGVVLERLSHYYTVGHGDTRLRSPAMIIVFEKKEAVERCFIRKLLLIQSQWFVFGKLIFIKNKDTFETKFTRYVSAVQRPSSVEVEFYFQLMMVVKRPKHVL